MQHSVYTGRADEELIQLFRQTFTDSEGEKEGAAIAGLVRKFLSTTPGEDLHVFITTDCEQLVASVIFSRIRFDQSSTNLWILSPAAVATAVQGKGVGQALIRYAHDFLKRQGVEAVVTYGDINFYAKVGYQALTEELIPAPLKLSYPEGWLGQSLTGEKLRPINGKSYCVEALNSPELW